MSEIKITDLVDQEAIDKVKELNNELKELLGSYTTTARELARGLEINVKVSGDIDKLDKVYTEKTREAAECTQRLNDVVVKQGQVIANTTNTISRQLMEQERVNKTQREAYTEHDKVKRLLEQYYDTYDGQIQRLVTINNQLKANSKEQKDNEKALKEGKMTTEQYNAAQADLVAQHRALTQEKRTLTQVMTAEEKASQTQEDSYVHLSQQLELMKKAYKELNESGRTSDFGLELETSIQNLDAHLKDMAADMGEFHRNVGNYAIAGQNGVVATDSLVAAMEQEAKTTQDLSDQMKILEEGKRMLNTEDANYQKTLEAVNAKIEENRRKLSDVSDIIDKEATSVAEAEAQNKRLVEALKLIDLTSEGAQKRVDELNAKIEANTRLIKDNTKSLQDEAKEAERLKKENESLTDSVLSLIGVNANLGSSVRDLGNQGNFIEGLNTKTKAFAQTLMGLLSNPWVLGFLGIAGVIAGFKWWYDFNKGILEASRLTKNFTDLTGDAADNVQVKLQTMADSMGKGFDDTIGAANTLVQQYGVSWDEAISLMKDGIQAGADMNGNFLNNINQFAPAMRDAGVEARQLIAILAETRNGIFDEKGVQDIIKGGTRLRSMTKQVAESLDACGISSNQMQKDLADGTITMLQAVQQVSSKLKELPENSQQAGQLMKNVFGRTAAEGGTLLIQSIADINTNLDEAISRMDTLGEVNREQMEAQEELNRTLYAVFKMGGTSFEEMTAKAKTFILKGITEIIKGCVDIANWFIRIYNNSEKFRGSLQGVIVVFKALWSVVKVIADGLVGLFKFAGEGIAGVMDIMEGNFTDGLDKIKRAWNTFSADSAKSFASAGEEIGGAWADAITSTAEGHLEEFKYELPDLEATGGTSANGTTANGDLPGGIMTDAQKKEAERQAKEELKRIQALEESKIAIMADSHEKQIALIRLKFKKKIDEITGDSDTEKALRIQLAAQCEQEVADCELKYQTELSKINLSNRLASVKKGSREELDLRLAQLEANRAAEIKAVEKTGADVNLIHAKFNRQRQELQEQFASSETARIQKEYSDSESMRNNYMLSEMNQLKAQYVEKLKAAKGNSQKMEEAEEEYQNKSAKIQENYARMSARASIDMLEESLKAENLSAEDRERLERELANAKMNLETLMADHSINEMKRTTTADQKNMEKRKAAVQQWLQVASEAISNVTALADALFEGQIEKIEAEQEANEEASDKEQERISELVEKKVITEEEGEARKRAAEAQTAKKNEELEKKKAEIKRKQAIWDKAAAVAQAGIATALAIMNALQTKPFPVGIAMAAIAGAMGAVQLATILATPIPKYAKGTDYHKGGPAIVGDGGHRELVLFDDSMWLTPDTPTLVDLPVGASVIPRIPAEIDPVGAMLMMSSEDSTAPRIIVNNDYSELKREVMYLGYLIKMQTRMQVASAYRSGFDNFKHSCL